MDKNRFKISFNNSGFMQSRNINTLVKNMPTVNSTPVNINAISRNTVKGTALNTPMIDRVHKAKPGCSACGKKVA